MSLAPLHRTSAPRARAIAGLVTVAAALTVSVGAAAALPTAYANTARGTRRAHTKARAHAKLHAHLHAKRLHTELHARLHTKSHARLHARLHAHHHLHALSTVAGIESPEVTSGGASLRGSHEAVDRAYDEAVREGLPFVHSNEELERRASAGQYVALARSTPTYQLKGVGSPYVRPATRDFVTSFAANYAHACGEPLTVTSAMRPTTIRLRNSVEKSVHPTGMAVDLRASRTGCLAWMRTTLLGLERDGVIDATEEHHPVHFHVVVLREP